MKTKIIISVLAIATIVGVALREKPVQSINALLVQTNDEGNVEIAITPLVVAQSAPTWDFKIKMDTHSVELDQDITKAAVLGDGRDDNSAPIAWEGTPAGGHHREGVLKFKPLKPRPKKINLKITNIGGIPERKYSWLVNK
ncbi:MAG TPA: hypothetical protein VJG48_00135 [Candidatus Paceibacterota bacterium]